MTAERKPELDPEAIRKAEQELVQTYLDHRDRLIGLAFKIGRVLDAEEMVQTGTIKVLASIRHGNYEERGQMLGFLTKVVANTAKSAARREHLDVIYMPDRGADIIGDPRGEGDPEKLAIEREQIRIVADAALQLPPMQKDILILWSQGFTHEEISKELGTSVNSSKVLLYKARKKIKKILARNSEEASGEEA